MGMTMQGKLTSNKMMRFALACFWAALFPVVCPAQTAFVQVRLPAGDALRIHGGENGPIRVARIGTGSHITEPVEIKDEGLIAATKGLVGLVAVGERAFSQDGRIYFVLAAALPTLPVQGTGYCGAGTEDRLLLVQWTSDQKLVLKDSLLVQSCLRSLSLRSDRGSDIGVLFSSDADPARIVLAWYRHPQYGSGKRTAIIRNGRFVVE